jgi:glycosyltransferase involved in cell wall biosynthesis
VAKRELHQFVVGAVRGDAITDQALLVQRWLREDGYRSELYAEAVDDGLAEKVHSYLHFQPSESGEVVILHHSIGSALVDHLLWMDLRFVLVYHNVTPPEFLEATDPALASQLSWGRSQLSTLRERTVLGLADSPYNEAEMRDLGYSSTGVLPIALDEPRYQLAPDPEIMKRYRNGGPNLLFVGRLVPNKRQEDLIKLLYHCRRVEPGARLFLVGAPWVPEYAEWLQTLARELGVEEAVSFAGIVSQRELVTYYQLADLYVSMSEHEGFGKPLIESMYFGVPVLAYEAAAVPGTMAGAGVLFVRKEYEALAELVSILVRDHDLGSRIAGRQRKRAEGFLGQAVRGVWRGLLEAVQWEAA